MTTRRLVFSLAAIAAALAAGAGLAWRLKPAPARPPAPSIRFTYLLPADQSFLRPGRRAVDISRDGSKILYLANRTLYVRALDSLTPRPVSGTPAALADPIFSPDGRWIAYFTPDSPYRLQKIPVAGGAPVTLCRLKGDVYGASWSNGRIVFGDHARGFSGIESVPDTGGTPKVLATLPPTEIAANPQLIDAGLRLLFAVFPPPGASTNATQILAQQSISQESRHTLIAGASDVRLLPGGRLVYFHDGTLVAAPFDSIKLVLTGPPAPLLAGVASASVDHQGQFAVANNGTLVYWPAAQAAPTLTIVTNWVQHLFAPPPG